MASVSSKKNIKMVKIDCFLSYFLQKLPNFAPQKTIIQFLTDKKLIMEKSAVQMARAAYQPKLPKALQGAVKAKEGAATQSVGDQEEIKKLFPNTYGMPIVEFEPATEANNTR